MRSASLKELLDAFPHDDVRPVQERALDFAAKQPNGCLLEIPTGEGKTAVGMSILRALSRKGKGPLFYVTPTKTQVEQIVAKHPEVSKIFGRSEYECLYYTNQGKPGVTAQESPCYMLQCPHRVDQDTGETEEDDADPCPYYQEKFTALRRSKDGGIVATTTAFYLMNRLMVAGWKEEEPEMTVVDEAHRLAQTARSIFEYQMTDYHLLRCADIVKPLDRRQTAILKLFVKRLRAIARRWPSRHPSLLKDGDLESLVDILDGLDAKALERQIRQAMKAGTIDPLGQKEELKLLENLVRRIPRMLRSLRFAMKEKGRRPLNYVVAFYFKKDEIEEGSKRKARTYLTIKSYFVQPVIKAAMGERTVAYSATIGDPKVFGYETGLTLPFASFASSFDVNRTRIYAPTDTKNLAFSKQLRHDDNKMLRLVIRSALRFAKAGLRSLVVVISEAERAKFLTFSVEEGLDVVSYGNGVRAKDAAAAFVAGQGQALLGTSSQYSEGVDLPKGVAPVIFFLRPGYAPKDSPESQFEERRFGNTAWAIWNYRVMLEALQVRGRNIRTVEDIGVCFFIDQRFKRFLYGSLPEWLKPAYRGQLTTEQAIKDALKLLG